MTLLLIRIGIVLLCLIGAAVEFLLPYLRSNGMGLARRRLRGQREVVDEENSGDDFDVCEVGSAAELGREE